MLENAFILYRARRYDIKGKLHLKTFVASKSGKIIYYQVTATMLAEETRERELRSLRSIQDNYEKVVLSMESVM